MTTAEHTHSWQAPEPCGHAEHPGKFINDWTDKERGAFLLGQKMLSDDNARLRDELQVWQQRFGDCEATISKQEVALLAIKRHVATTPMATSHALMLIGTIDEALDAVPRRAASTEVAG